MTADGKRQALRPTEIVEIPVHDGIKIAAAVYRPPEPGRYPALLAASPYRFDNNLAPAVPVFLWRETGPIDYYLRHGYAFVHVDVRGTGRSQGEYRYMDEAEQRDLHDVIVWITRQPWSSGKVGGIGQSYYARMQWFMGIRNPPGLTCIAPYDGNIDTYRNSAFTGGIPGAFPSTWYNSTTRAVNQYPIDGPSRLLTWDYPGEVQRHPTYDEFWKVRTAAENIERIKVPIFSIGVWSKVDLHLNGNIVGFQRARAPKKLLVFGSSNLFAAVADFSSEAFHEKYLRPFYDCYLKDEDTSYPAEPAVPLLRHQRRPVRQRRRMAAEKRVLSVVLSAAGAHRLGHIVERWRARSRWSGHRPDALRLSRSWLARGRGRVRRGGPARSGSPRADLHVAAARA